MSDRPRLAPSRRTALALTLACLCAPGAPALAHKLKVFATAMGDRIEGSAYFAGGHAAGGASVLILDRQGHELARLAPGPDGHFSYRATAPIEHRIVAQTGDGHQAEWILGADELAPAFPAAERPPPTPASGRAPSDTRASAEQPAAESPPDSPGSAPGAALDAERLAAMEQAIARQLRPLRGQIAAAEDATRLRDVLGGLGYILGIAGLALWWRCRTRGPRP